MRKRINLKRIIFGTAMTMFIAFVAMFVYLTRPDTSWKALSVQSGSMEPAIATGSLVFVRSVSNENLNVGDVVTYSSLNGSKTITHRISDIEPRKDGLSSRFITKGDANRAADAPVSDRRIVGKVYGHLPYAGNIFNFMRTWPGLILLVYLPALIIVILEFRLMFKRLFELNEKEENRRRRYSSPAWENLDLLAHNSSFPIQQSENGQIYTYRPRFLLGLFMTMPIFLGGTLASAMMQTSSSINSSTYTVKEQAAEKTQPISSQPKVKNADEVNTKTDKKTENEQTVDDGQEDINEQKETTENIGGPEPLSSEGEEFEKEKTELKEVKELELNMTEENFRVETSNDGAEENHTSVEESESKKIINRHEL